MKAIVVYYSYSGNTKSVAEFLAGYLREKFRQVDVVELKTRESRRFLTQAIRALKKVKSPIQPVDFDLSDYDLICLGTPVWAFSPAPGMNTFLDRCFGLESKSIVLFCTYGSGLGKERCLDYMQEILSKKGAKKFRRFSIQQFKARDKEFVFAKLKEVFLDALFLQ